MAKKNVTTMTKSTTKTTSCGYSAQDLEKIRTRAYYIWETKGKPTNQDFSIWLESEKALRKEKLIR